MWKSGLKMNREKWLILLACGVLLLIISFPPGGMGDKKAAGALSGLAGTTSPGGENDGENTALTGTFSGADSEGDERAYAKELELRVKEILKHVEGVGKVDVMITLRSSGEKVLHVDKDKSRSSTEEKDSAGGTRKSMSEDVKETALLAGSGTAEPVVEKELLPEIEGIIISAQGGGSAAVKAEISDAMQALFNIPAHKIKVLKRVE